MIPEVWLLTFSLLLNVTLGCYLAMEKRQRTQDCITYMRIIDALENTP